MAHGVSDWDSGLLDLKCRPGPPASSGVSFASKRCQVYNEEFLLLKNNSNRCFPVSGLKRKGTVANCEKKGCQTLYKILAQVEAHISNRFHV